METLEPIIAGHPFFKGLDPRHLALIVGCASNVRFDPGQFIFREGEKANHFYLVRQGRIDLEVYAPGRGPVVIQSLGDGDVLGWSWVIPPYHWHFDAHAQELTRAIALDGNCLRTKCEEDHDLGYELLKRFAGLVADRLQAERARLLEKYRAVS